jgi:threonine dehydrogenase-like Zn-dependent dehydrogenase
MGATHTLNPKRDDVVKAVSDLTDGKLADFVVEAVGKEETFNQCTKLTKHSGSIVYFGVPNKENEEGLMRLKFLELFAKEIEIITSVGPKPLEDYTIALDWITQGRLDVRPMLTHVWDFERIQEAFELAFDHPESDGALKVILKF